LEFITARGVLSSWDASAIKAVCFSQEVFIGFMDLFARKKLTVKTVLWTIEQYRYL